MRIAVDADNLSRYPSRGIQRVQLNLYQALARQQPTWTFLFFRQLATPVPWFDEFPNIVQLRVDIRGDRWRGSLNLWEQVRLPLAALRHRADLLHCIASTAPAFSPVPKVTTIHDLNPLDFAPTNPATAPWFRNVRRAARSSARVITASEYTKRDIVARAGALPARVEVIAWAAADQYRHASPDTAAARVALGLPERRPYVLALGSVNPNKNMYRVIEAWQHLGPAARAQHALFVVGVEADAVASVRQQVVDRGLASDCFVAGPVPDEHMPALFAGAALFLYLSLSEGFGLPIVDAFAAGTTVLTSNVTSIPEVVGDAGVMVDPTSVPAITEALAALLAQPARRQALAKAGRQRERTFSWDACARAHADLFVAVKERR